MQHFLFLFFGIFCVVQLFVHHPPYVSSLTSPAASHCSSVNKASRQTRPGVPRRSWPWGSCCGCRQPPRPRSGCSGPGSSGCWFRRRLRLPSRTADEWGSARPRRSLVPPWRTDRIQSLLHNTGRSWTGSSGSGCLSRVAAGRCGTGRRLTCSSRWCRCWKYWRNKWRRRGSACGGLRSEGRSVATETGRWSSGGRGPSFLLGYKSTNKGLESLETDHKTNIQPWMKTAVMNTKQRFQRFFTSYYSKKWPHLQDSKSSILCSNFVWYCPWKCLHKVMNWDIFCSITVIKQWQHIIPQPHAQDWSYEKALAPQPSYHSFKSRLTYSILSFSEPWKEALSVPRGALNKYRQLVALLCNSS